MTERIQQLSNMIAVEARQINRCFDFRTLNNKRILITGASGLLGIYFLACLRELLDELDRIEIYAVIHSELSDFMVPLISSKGIEIIRGDLTDDHFCGSLPSTDIVIHSAGYAQPAVFMENPLKTLRLNTLTTFKLFEKLNVGGKFLFISSSEVYNGAVAEEYSENIIGNTNTTNPRACYIEGKKAGETICNSYGQMGVNVSSIRLSLTYGPGMKMNDERVLPSLIQKGLRGTIELVDSGEATRTFCYISDAIEMMWYVILNGEQNIYNVGGIMSTTIRQMAEIIAQQMQVTLKVPNVSSAIPGAPKNVRLNLDRLLSKYPKTTFVDLNEGLKRTIEWYKRLANA
jgi:UDP-glucuronate decarboxylase